MFDDVLKNTPKNMNVSLCLNDKIGEIESKSKTVTPKSEKPSEERSWNKEEAFIQENKPLGKVKSIQTPQSLYRRTRLNRTAARKGKNTSKLETSGMNFPDSNSSNTPHFSRGKTSGIVDS